MTKHKDFLLTQQLLIRSTTTKNHLKKMTNLMMILNPIRKRNLSSRIINRRPNPNAPILLQLNRLNPVKTVLEINPKRLMLIPALMHIRPKSKRILPKKKSKKTQNKIKKPQTMKGLLKMTITLTPTLCLLTRVSSASNSLKEVLDTTNQT